MPYRANRRIGSAPRRAIVAVASGLAALLLTAPGLAQGAASSPPPVEASAALLANATTGEIMWSRSPRRALPIASITKIMTALVTLNRTEPDDVVTVSARAASVGGATVDLASGEEISVEDLLEATLIPSANDAANALADHVGRRGGAKRFVRLMNRKAQRMGLTDTVFVRPDGLDVAGHVSSARDVLRLTAEAMRNPLFRSIVGTETATIAGGRKLETTNGLLATYRGTYGVKTGHTDSAGWSEAAAARRNGVSLYAVVLGGPSEARRDTDLRRLLNWGFSQFGRVTVISEGRTYARADIPFQSDRQLELIGDRSVSRVVQFGKPLVERVVAPASVRLPVVAGEPRGTVQIIAGDRVIAQRPLVASESIGEPDVTSRIGWYARRTMSHASDLLNSVLGVIW